MMRLRLPEMPRFLRRGALSLPHDCCPAVDECVTSGALLLEQAGIETARLDAECLVAAVLGCARWQLTLEPHRRLAPDEFGRILRLLQRRERREPLAYILGTREFWSLPLAVSAGVFLFGAWAYSLIVREGLHDRGFLATRCTGFDAVERELRAIPVEDYVRRADLPLADVEKQIDPSWNASPSRSWRAVTIALKFESDPPEVRMPRALAGRPMSPQSHPTVVSSICASAGAAPLTPT